MCISGLDDKNYERDACQAFFDEYNACRERVVRSSLLAVCLPMLRERPCARHHSQSVQTSCQAGGRKCVSSACSPYSVEVYTTLQSKERIEENRRQSQATDPMLMMWRSLTGTGK